MREGGRREGGTDEEREGGRERWKKMITEKGHCTLPGKQSTTQHVHHTPLDFKTHIMFPS